MLVSMCVLVWWVHPSYTVSGAILLTPFAGNWPALGVPGPLSPDRLLLAGAIVAVLLRAPPIADRPRLQITARALGSRRCRPLRTALCVGRRHVGAARSLLQDRRRVRHHAVPPLPRRAAVIFASAATSAGPARARSSCSGPTSASPCSSRPCTLDALVFPKYILDPHYGIHAQRGRGPFVDAVANGLALYTCAVACAIAVASWRRAHARAGRRRRPPVRRRQLPQPRALGLDRGPARHRRRDAGHARPAALPRARSCSQAPSRSARRWRSSPGCRTRSASATNDSATVWDRKNLARAAVNMVEARPLFGFGWSRFTQRQLRTTSRRRSTIR